VFILAAGVERVHRAPHIFFFLLFAGDRFLL
jgi:hypothetical protein